MQTTGRSQNDSRLKRDASNFDDYMLAVALTALVGILIAL
jgi:hypothetical protein